jgi:hypothetical protein
VAHAVDKVTKKPIADLPLAAAFEKGAGDVFPNYKTDASGLVKILLTKISSRDMEQTVGVKVDMMNFVGQTQDEIYSLVAQKMVVPKAVVLMKVQRPLVYVSAVEKKSWCTKE